ncbi:UdgX family uracil-DNA binding protein [Blastococcus haudaquaticus]|uniref:UdgX family uracil-DNA binding protein n=1 Tax=Blastococcus haudaquaticus TaxID=1938745 RepID=UPI0027153116|nr:UdgX family uracil-DNA binding protein [Blastococcus haudaquaticus]
MKPTPSSTRLSPKLLWSPSNSSTCPPEIVGCRTVSAAHLASRAALRCHRRMTGEQGRAQPPDGVGLDGLRAAAAGCRACELWEPATQTVFGEGPETARIVFVGEQPGDREDRTGEPFVGPAGRLLDKALGDAGIDRRDAYISNAVKHFRFTAKGKRRIHQTPGPEHLRACRPWLEAEFAVLRPEVVVCLGATAAKALISPSFRITRDRGQLLPWTPPGAALPVDDGHLDDGHQEADDDEPDEGAPAQTWMLATTHPSAILRTPDEARDAAYAALVADLTVVAHALA